MKFCLKILCITLCLALGAAALAGCSSQSAPASSGSAASVSGTGAEAHEPGLFIDGERAEADPVLKFNGGRSSVRFIPLYFSHVLRPLCR